MRECMLVFVLLASFSVVYSVDFEECGGDPVHSVQITGCTESLCELQRGETYNVFITMEYIYPVVDSVVVDAEIMQYGANFKQTIVVNNPCIYGCPVIEELNQPKFDIDVKISRKLIGIPGYMEINGTYYKGQYQTSGFCIAFLVNII